MKAFLQSFSLLTLCLFCFSTSLSANPDVTSREYKLMLKTDQFKYQSEASDVAALLQDAENVIEQALGRNVNGIPLLEKQRDVRFFDTPSSCLLKGLGYAFRKRFENGDSEVTLKFRGPDRYISDFAATTGAETKLEADIGANTFTDFKVIYGHSTSAPNTRTLNEMRDINAHFPGFETDYNLNDTLPLSVVGYLTVREHVYRNEMIDLGQFDAEISVTLWYQGEPTSGKSPLIAEISFKYADAAADYTRKVVNRAKSAFEDLQTLGGWVDPYSTTKTTFIYAYSAGFFQSS